MQPLEGLEQFAQVKGVKAGPVVPHVAADGTIFRRLRAELDERIVPVRGELPGVLDQILQDRADKRGICSDLGQALDSEVDVSVGLLTPELPGNIVDLGAEVDGLEVHSSSRRA